MATKATAKVVKSPVLEVYVRVSKRVGAKGKDTVAHAAKTVEEAIAFIKNNAK